MLILLFFINFENCFILKSHLVFKFEVEFHQKEQSASLGDLQRNVMIMTSSQSYGLINPNRIAYVYIVVMQSKCKYKVVLKATCMSLFILHTV